MAHGGRAPPARSHRGDEDRSWATDDVVGCAYPDERQVFAQRGETYITAAGMLRAKAEAQPGVCRATPEGTAQLASR